MRARWYQRLVGPIDVASLVAFRVIFGAILCGASLRVLARGWVHTLYLAPAFHFTWGPFDFVRPWPGAGMYLHLLVLAAAGLGLAIGWHHRLCAAVLCAGFTFLELVDKALYLNHYYLVALLAGLLALLPVGRNVDRVPAWVLLILRLQIGVVYVFAGVAKLNRDWLLEAQPLRLWLAARADWPLVGPLLARPATAFVASWAGALFDLGVVPLLLWARTRRPAFAAVMGFHLLTGLLFPIGVFPWLMTAGATLLFAPDWPRRWLRVHAAGSRVAVPHPLVAAVVVVHALVQVALPLRQHLQADSAWTVRGFNFGWKVMLVEKTGAVDFEVIDDGRAVRVAPRRYLTPVQEEAMAQDPDMIRALARHIAADLGRDHRVAVRADAFCALDGRAPRRLIDPTVDLAGPLPATWILPLAP